MRWKNLKICTVLFFITNACFLLCGIHTLTTLTKKATILSMMVGSFLAYLLIFFHLKRKENRILSLTEQNKLTKIIIILLSLFILNFSLGQITGFITYNVVASIPYYFIIATFLLACIFASSKGFSTITRATFIFFLIFCFLTMITFIALFPKMDFQSILPIVDTSWQNILKSTGIYLMIATIPYFYLQYFHLEITKETRQDLKKGFILTHIFIIFYCLVIFSILGINITNLYPYPEVSIFKKVSFLNIIDRMESVFSLSYFLCLFTHFSITLYGITKLLETWLPKKKRVYTLSITAFLLFVSSNYLKSNILLFFLAYFILIGLTLFTHKSS